MKLKALLFIALFATAGLFSFTEKSAENVVLERRSQTLKAYLLPGSGGCGWIWEECGTGTLFTSPTIPYQLTQGKLYLIERERVVNGIQVCYEVISATPTTPCPIP